MALSTDFCVTNYTNSTYKQPHAYDLGERSNYSNDRKESKGQVTYEMKNLTQNSLMYGEIVDRWFKQAKEINSPLAQYCNSPVDGMNHFGIQVDAIVKTDDDANPMTGDVRDIVQTIIIQKWTPSPYVTAALLDKNREVAMSHFYNQTDGSSRMPEFMRGCINPETNTI